MIRKALLVISAVGLLGLAAACTTSEAPIVRTSGMSPPPPPSAPVELVSRIAGAVTQPVKESRATTGEVEGDPIEVNLEDPGGSGKYAYDPGDLTFNVGDVIAFTLTAETEFHTFTVDDLEIDEAVDASDSIRFSFTFDQAGTYDLICIPHEAQGMVATITVR
jgi:plastocyanin